MNNKIRFTLVGIAALALANVAAAKDDYPDQTTDGLKRMESKNVDAMYWQDGATLDGYNKVLVMDAEVAFRKDWMRDYNREAMGGVSRRATSEDMEKIKQNLSEEFNKVFTKEIQDGGYEVVTEPAADVLVLRPAIVNLDVEAPDLNTSSMDRTYVASAGQMTLYMEFYDSVTGAKIGTVIDAQGARDTGFMQYASKITNRQEADKILRKWSGLLVKALDRAHNKEN
jgi:hypothetical protein